MKPFVYLSIIFVAFTAAILGFDTAIIENSEFFITNSLGLEEQDFGWINKVCLLVGTVFLLIAGFIANKRGRKTTLIAALLLYIVATLVTVTASGFNMFFAGRLLTSIAFSLILVTVPVYIAELAPKNLRGAFVVFGIISILLGKYFGYWYHDNYLINAQNAELGYLNNYQTLKGFIPQTNRWGLMLLCGVLFSIIGLFLLFFVPKSARWLVSKKDASAKLYLDKFYSEDKAKEIYTDIKKSYFNLNPKYDDWGKPEDVAYPKAKFGDIFSGAVFPMLVLSFFIGIAYKLCGSEAILNIKDTILDNYITDESSIFNNRYWFFYLTLIASIAALFLVEFFGRKRLLMLGIAGITLSSLFMSYSYDKMEYKIDDNNIGKIISATGNRNFNILKGKTFTNIEDLKVESEKVLRAKSEVDKHFDTVLKLSQTVNNKVQYYCLLGLLLFSAMALAPLLNVIGTEIFPNWIRSVAFGFVLFLTAIFGYMAYNSFDWLIENYGGVYTFFAFALLGLLTFCYMGFRLLETKNLALEEIPELFTHRRPTVRAVKEISRTDTKIQKKESVKPIDKEENTVVIEERKEKEIPTTSTTSSPSKPAIIEAAADEPIIIKPKKKMKGLDLDIS